MKDDGDDEDEGAKEIEPSSTYSVEKLHSALVVYLSIVFIAIVFYSSLSKVFHNDDVPACRMCSCRLEDDRQNKGRYEHLVCAGGCGCV